MKKILLAGLLVTGMYAGIEVKESPACEKAVEDLYVSDREARRERERGSLSKVKKYMKLSLVNIEKLKKECTMREGEEEYLNSRRDILLKTLKSLGQ